MPEKGEIRQYSVIREFSEMGRSRILIECPFCGETFWAYVWSLAGCGKKCPRCGAKHFWSTGSACYTEDKK